MYTPECYVFNDGNSSSALTAALNGGMGGAWNNPIWALAFLAFLGRGFGGEWGNNNQSQLAQIQDTLNTNQGNTLLMNAISGNATSIKELANAIGCNHNAVTAAINGVQGAVCSVGNQLGMGTAQVINAVQSGDTSIITALKDCCCQTQQNIIKMGYDNQINNLQQSQQIQSGFCQVGYEAAQNANGIKQAILDQTLSIKGELNAMDKARLERENATLTAQIATLTARAERQAELAPIYKTLEEIKNKQPNTVSVPYPQLTAIPNYMLYGAGIAAAGAAGVFGLSGNSGGIFG